MDKKNVVEGGLINNGIAHIGDITNNYLGIPEAVNPKSPISKSTYRTTDKAIPFNTVACYIPRTLTHLKSIQEAKRFYYPEQENRPLKELLDEKKKIVLLGDAGMGKSTELKRFYNELLASDEDVFPVWISLNSHIPEGTLENYLTDIQSIPSGNIYLIMDGYDEISTSDYPKLIRQIENLLADKKDIKILISSRKNTYDIDSGSSNSSLQGFETYYLNELTLLDVEKYLDSFDQILSFKEFMQELERVKLSDLVKNPFYLNIIVDLYLSDNALPDSRSELMQHCVDKIIVCDGKRNRTVVHIENTEVLRVITKVALTMELLNKNTISNLEFNKVIDTHEITTLKYFGGFKKETGKNDLWKFDHNNFQEYLAAKSISHCSFDEILKCISFEPNYDILNPSWLNTIGYLLSEIKDGKTLDNFIAWLIEHNKHFLVSVENTKIDKEIRIKVFKEIFNEYERDNLFLYSNHFTDDKLVNFASDHEQVFNFLTAKINTSDSVKVKSNAFRLLGFLDYSNYRSDFDTLFDLCYQIIENQNITVNALILQESVSCLVQTQLLTEDQIENIFNHLSYNTYEGIISVSLNLINQSKLIDKYINYLSWSFNIIHDNHSNDFGLIYKSEKSLERINSKKGIYQLLKFLNEVDWTWEKVRSLGFLKNIMNNAILLYKDDKTIFETILYTVDSPKLLSLLNFQSEVLQFFIETNTRDQAFNELWKLKINGKCNSYMLSLLVTTDTIHYLMPEINSDKEYDGKNWLYSIHSSSNDLKQELDEIIYENRESVEDEYSKFIVKQTNFKQYSFDLLFNFESFKSEMLCAISLIDKKQIAREDIKLLTPQNYREYDSFKTPNCIISLLQGLLYQEETIMVSQITDFIENEEKLLNYRIIKIREKVHGNHNLIISDQNINYLEKWVRDILYSNKFSKIDSRLKHCIADFIVRFDFEFSDDILIQFVTYENLICYNTTFFNWLKTKLSPKVMVRNIIDILKSDQKLPESVILNFYKYLNENRIRNISHNMIESIKNTTFDQHHRICFIDEYIKSGGNFSKLKNFIDLNDDDVYWCLIDKFVAKGENEFVLKILISNIADRNLSQQNRIKTIERLVMLENNLGFDLYLSEICETNVAKIDHWKVIKNLKHPESTPFLFTLLELCLSNQNKVDVFDRSTSDVSRSIEGIAMISYDNFQRIRMEYDHLMRICPNDAPYLISLSHGLTDRYYRSKAENRSLSEVKDIMKQIGM